MAVCAFHSGTPVHLAVALAPGFLALGLVLLAVLCLLLKRYYAPGKITQSFLQREGDVLCLFLLLDYEVTNTSRQGMTVSHCYKLKKIDLEQMDVEYEVELIRFGWDMVGGSWNIIGSTEDFSFSRSGDRIDELIIVNNKEARIQATRKTIIDTNPHLDGFETSLVEYDRSLQTIVIFDKHGDPFVLDPGSLDAKPLESVTAPRTDPPPPLRSLRDVPHVEFSELALSILGPRSNPNSPTRVDVLPDNDGGGYFVHVKEESRLPEPKEPKRSFVSPRLLATVAGEPALSGHPRSVVTLHGHTTDLNVDGTFLSRVVHRSHAVWTHKIGDLIARPELVKAEYLSLIDFKNKLYVVFWDGNHHKTSMCTIDRDDGALLDKPRLFVHRNHRGKVL